MNGIKRSWRKSSQTEKFEKFRGKYLLRSLVFSRVFTKNTLFSRCFRMTFLNFFKTTILWTPFSYICPKICFAKVFCWKKKKKNPSMENAHHDYQGLKRQTFMKFGKKWRFFLILKDSVFLFLSKNFLFWTFAIHYHEFYSFYLILISTPFWKFGIKLVFIIISVKRVARFSSLLYYHNS